MLLQYFGVRSLEGAVQAPDDGRVLHLAEVQLGQVHLALDLDCADLAADLAGVRAGALHLFKVGVVCCVLELICVRNLEVHLAKHSAYYLSVIVNRMREVPKQVVFLHVLWCFGPDTAPEEGTGVLADGALPPLLSTLPPAFPDAPSLNTFGFLWLLKFFFLGLDSIIRTAILDSFVHKPFYVLVVAQTVLLFAIVKGLFEVKSRRKRVG